MKFYNNFIITHSSQANKTLVAFNKTNKQKRVVWELNIQTCLHPKYRAWVSGGMWMRVRGWEGNRDKGTNIKAVTEAQN